MGVLGGPDEEARKLARASLVRLGTAAVPALAIRTLAIDGEIAAPTVRAIPVTPAAAERSSASTTAITYDWRVGTSIWLSENRSSKTATASGRVGG